MMRQSAGGVSTPPALPPDGALRRSRSLGCVGAVLLYGRARIAASCTSTMPGGLVASCLEAQTNCRKSKTGFGSASGKSVRGALKCARNSPISAKG